MPTTSPKTRGNYYMPFKKGQFERIFGERKGGEKRIVHAETLKDRMICNDDPKYRESVKIGREINKMKAHGEGHRVEKEFARDANKIHEKQVDPKIASDMAADVIRAYRQGYDPKLEERYG